MERAGLRESLVFRRLRLVVPGTLCCTLEAAEQSMGDGCTRSGMTQSSVVALVMRGWWLRSVMETSKGWVQTDR